MALILKKFGGSSLKNKNKLDDAAKIIQQDYLKGHDVVVVVSAQGDTTDNLIGIINEITKNPSKRESDVVFSTGEMLSMAFLVMSLENIGLPAISLTGWQAGFFTDINHCNARIKNIKTDRIINELQKKHIVVISGFQGVNKYDDITTLGRGGSDTSAVAIAAALNADKCQIYTDVEGVYSTDPRDVDLACHLNKINYDEMLELASSGAKVLHNRAVEIAKKYGVSLEVLSTCKNSKSTIVKEITEMEKLLVSGIAKDCNISMITLYKVQSDIGLDFKLFSLLANNKIRVDLITQSIIFNEKKDITFTLPSTQLNDALGILNENKHIFNFESLIFDENVAKISIVGAGMQSNPEVASKIFEILAENMIKIEMISTSEIKISIMMNKKYIDKALYEIHKEFL